jgi:uncharacterized protein YlxP (DUF503 family)
VVSASSGYIAVLEVELHFPEAHDLKAKRRELKSLRDLIRGRFGAAVAETDFHDKWQRAALTVALVDGSHHHLGQRADELARWLEGRAPAGLSVHCRLRSVQELE